MQFFLREPKAAALPDVLGWNIMISPEIILTKQSEFLSVIRYRPRDLCSSSPSQLTAARSSLNTAIRRFGNGWCLWFESQRNSSAEYPDSVWPDPVSQLLDDERRSRFTAPGAQLVSAYYISLLYSPPSDAVGKLAAHFEQSAAGDRTTAKRAAAQREIFENGVAQLLGHLKAFMPRAELLAGDDLVTYLHSTVSTQRFKVRQPPLPCFLAEVLADEDYVSGYYPRLGDHHMRTIRIKDFGDDTCPGILDELNRLPFEFRNVARWLPFDREAAEAHLESERKSWESSRLGLLAHFMPKLFTARNMEAELGTEEAEAALTSLASGAVSWGFYSHTITVSHPDVDIVNDRMKRVALIIHGNGLACSEAKIDSMSAWLGSVPGHPAADLGRYLMNSLTFSELLPATAPWDGPERDEHLGGTALLRGMSDGGSPFNLSIYQEGTELGHMLLIGQSRAGKSVLLSRMAAAHRKYRGSRVIFIDRDESSKGITLALGGTFHALATDDAAISLQPLAHIDDPAERAWADEFIVGILAGSGVIVTPPQREEITRALEVLATRAPHHRTLTGFRLLVQDDAGELKPGLAPWCQGGANGDLLDNSQRRLGSGADVTSYETSALLKRPTAIGPVMAAVFHEISRCFDGRPLFLPIDEAWSFLDNPMLSGQLREWLKTGGKAGVSAVMSTQSPTDIATSSIREVLSESCPHRIWTANNRAQETATAATMTKLGLTPEMIAIVAGLKPKAEYAYSGDGCWRKFELKLTPVELAFTGRSRPEDRRAMDAILARYGREEYPRRWLAHCGLDPDLLPELTMPFAAAAE